MGYGWDTSHPITISKKSIILIYHYLHIVQGLYTEDSDAYWISRTHALWPPCYEKKTITILFLPLCRACSIHRRMTSHCHSWRSVYRWSSRTHTIWTRTSYWEWHGLWNMAPSRNKILVEVHAIPDSIIDRHFAQLWDKPPHGIVYVQPHGFLHPDTTWR